MGQGKGAAVDPMSSIPISKYEDLVWTLTSAVSLEMKHKVYAKGSLAVSCCANGLIRLRGSIIARLRVHGDTYSRGIFC